MVEMVKMSKYTSFGESGLFQYYFTMDGDNRTTYKNIKNTFLAPELCFVSYH